MREEEITTRLLEIESEKKSLLEELSRLRNNSIQVSILGTIFFDNKPETPDEKIKLFLSLFGTRTDVYPRLWENKKGIRGYSPVCENEWVSGICNKPRVKCHDCPLRSFLLLDEKAIQAHLEGKITAGVYAIDRNDKCLFIAADFDGENWEEDVLSYCTAAKGIGIHSSIEISRSGEGAHAWIFFDSPVFASDARKIGSIIMANAQKEKGVIKLESYDRFFPNQDLLPEGGFGNLIALPLQKKIRDKGLTVFVDENLSPYPDQWEMLSSVSSLSASDVEYLLSDYKDLSKSTTGDSEDTFPDTVITLKDSQITGLLKNRKVMIRFGSGIFIKRSEIISRIEYALRQIATFSNPKYYELQRMRFPTWGTPRYISLADREKDDLFLPRGLFEKACEIFLKANADITVSDERPISPQCDIDFSGILDEKQIKAVETLLLHENGLLVAPPGSGKTVMACALIAQRNVPTLVLVHRDQLVTQWIEQLTKFLKIKKSQIGVLGGTRKKLKGMIDIAMLQTVSRREDSSSVLSQYGLIIIDECHHIPAVSFESTLRNANVRYIVGLTATPYRKDGLHPIISMHCGPVRYEIKESRTDEIERTVIVRASSFKIDESSGERPPIHIVWDALVKDEQRLSLIARDVAEILSISRFPVILSDRKEHLSLLHEYIQQSSLSSVGYIITGDMGEKERASILDKIKTRLANDEATFILSTGSLLGEGFDFSECDTLFIAMPISFKGRVIQYAGRLHRSHEGKEKILIYDYVDCNSGLALSMFKKRISAYREMGYIIELPDNESICRIVARTKIGTRKTSITEYGKYSR